MVNVYITYININVGLYRDDGLAITNATPRDTENIKKEICRIFNNNGLRITIEANKQIINFLDVTFNLNIQQVFPFSTEGSAVSNGIGFSSCSCIFPRMIKLRL